MLVFAYWFGQAGSQSATSKQLYTAVSSKQFGLSSLLSWVKAEELQMGYTGLEWETLTYEGFSFLVSKWNEVCGRMARYCLVLPCSLLCLLPSGSVCFWWEGWWWWYICWKNWKDFPDREGAGPDQVVCRIVFALMLFWGCKTPAWNPEHAEFRKPPVENCGTNINPAVTIIRD